AFDIFVLPSRSEALAYVLIEAAQAGLPVVATRVGGIPEIITDTENGLLVPSLDVDALATALRKMLADHPLRDRLAKNNQTNAARFSLEKMIDQTEAVYDC